jgi:uncharacterized membrane protein (Fun14 family)
MLMSVAMAIANASIESVVRMLLSNPDVVVKSFAVMIIQFIVGAAFGYFAVRALKYILVLIGLTLLLSYITTIISPIPISTDSLLQVAKALLPIFTLSTGPFLAGVIVGGMIGLFRR